MMLNAKKLFTWILLMLLPSTPDLRYDKTTVKI
jgi:hypothetical protein